MYDKVKLLITARDPATANELIQILPTFLAQERFMVKVVAQEPAYAIFCDSNLNLKNKLVACSADSSKETIELSLKAVFQSFNPDCLLTGISGPGYGVDEIALSMSDSYGCLESFSIQSYWGDLNTSCGVIAKTVFVKDEFASLVTGQRNSRCKRVITGTIQSNKYDAIDIEQRRIEYKNQYGHDNEQAIIALFGQPLFEFAWYKETIAFFITVLNEIALPVRLIYKPHPKESDVSIDWVEMMLDNLSIESSIDRQTDSLTILTGTDIAVSLFSTIGYDLQNLLARSNNAFSIPMYLFFHDDCIRWFQKYCFLESIPMSYADMSIVIKSKATLKTALVLALKHEEKQRCQKAVLNHFPLGTSEAAQIISETILMQLKNA